MTSEERADLLDRLARANEDARERQRQREEERELDPLLMDDHLRGEREAEREAAAEAERRAYVRRRADARGMIHRRQENEPAPAPAGSAAPSDADGYVIDPATDEKLAQVIGTVAASLRDEWRKDMAALHKRTLAVRHDLTKLREQVDSAEAGGIDVYSSHLDRRVAVLEAENIKLKALLGPAADVVELPKGFLRRTHHNAA